MRRPPRHPRPQDPGPRHAARRPVDAGVGIIEILVAMTLFGLLMAAVTPLLLNSITTTARAAQLATASQIANQQLERARSAATDCAQLKAHLVASSGVAQAQVHDSRGITYAVSETAASAITCPDVDGLVSYTVTVTAQTNTAKPVKASIETEIWVGK
jgi:type II secretory pathway pseudopilin PulG